MPKLQITSPNGGTLNMAGTYCDSDIEIIPKLQDKTVTENGTVTADEGYAGLREVTVNVLSEGFSILSNANGCIPEYEKGNAVSLISIYPFEFASTATGSITK